MNQRMLERREQIKREFKELQDKGWDREDIYEELGKRFFLAPETIRQNVSSLGSYRDAHEKPPRAVSG